MERATQNLYEKLRRRLLHLKHGMTGKMPLHSDPHLAELDKELANAVEHAPNVFEKFAKIRPHTTLEENLIWSKGKNDVVFCVAQEL